MNLLAEDLGPAVNLSRGGLSVCVAPCSLLWRGKRHKHGFRVEDGMSGDRYPWVTITLCVIVMLLSSIKRFTNLQFKHTDTATITEGTSVITPFE